MTVLPTGLDTNGPEYAAHRATMVAKLAELEAEHGKALAGGGEKYVARHRKRGKLPARERIELLVDPDTPFLELSPLAAWGSEYAVGASLVTGIGVVEGVECLITANDPTVRGGASNPWTLKKALRANEIAFANRLPAISLVESGGADLPSQKEIFIPGGALFRDITRLSAAHIPTVAVVFGNSTAGGAYVPGMSDHTVMIKERSKVFLGGPPLVKMATGEESDDESLGGAEMHARTSGLADHFAVDEQDAIRQARRIVARLNWRKAHADPGPAEPPKYDEDELLGIVPGDLKVPFDPREVIARLVDGSDFDAFKPLYGTSLVTGWARLHGYPVGILANAQGVLFSEESQKAAQFIQLANQRDIPLLFLHNTTGYMVGKEYEQGGIIKHGAMMINAVANSKVPHLSVLMGASYGPATTACAAAPTIRASSSPGRAASPPSWARSSSPGSCPSSPAPPPPPRGSRTTTRPTPGSGRWWSSRSRRSRCRCSCPGGCTTTGSSTRATPGPSSACACPRSTPHRSRAPAAASASSGCDRR